VKAHINSCKVYSFKNDEAYRSLYRESIDKLPKNEIESFERRVITNLTGLVLDVDIIQQDPAKNFQFKDVKKIFYRTTETEFCEHDKDSKYFLTINSSCAMFRLDIPQGIRWHVVDTPEKERQDEVKIQVIKKGLTWAKHSLDKVTGVITVGCGHTKKEGNQCNPYNGDTSCDSKIPMLCFLDADLPKPTLVPITNRYQSWSGGIVGTTNPIAGNSFINISDANEYCRKEFGEKWRVATHHDGWGWYFKAFGGVGSNVENLGSRFWVDIHDQPFGTCWAR
jgi:hypothetical protein